MSTATKTTQNTTLKNSSFAITTQTDLQCVGRIELGRVADEDTGPLGPGSEEVAVGRLGPARVGDVPVDVSGNQIQPVPGNNTGTSHGSNST